MERRFRDFGGKEIQHVSLGRVVLGLVFFFFLSYCIPVAHSRYLVVPHYKLILDLLKDFST